jgi:serine/threonine-protein kinase
VGEILDERARIVAEIERSSTRSKPPLPMPGSGSIKLQAVPVAAVEAGVPTSGIIAAEPPKPRSMAVAGFAMLLTLLAVLLVVIAVLLGRGPQTAQSAGAPSASAATASAPVTSASPAETAEPPETATAAVIRRPGAATPPATGTATATATSTATAKAQTGDKPAQPTSPPPRGRVNCDPPYVVDKNGHQHFIPECLK